MSKNVSYESESFISVMYEFIVSNVHRDDLGPALCMFFAYLGFAASEIAKKKREDLVESDFPDIRVDIRSRWRRRPIALSFASIELAMKTSIDKARSKAS